MKTTPIPSVPAQSAASDWALGGSEQCSSKPRLAPLRGKEHFLIKDQEIFPSP
jgi:hypothetical protein